MSYLSARRMLSACVVSVAAVVAMAAPGTASATSDLTEQCSGSNIKGLGSTFQAAAQEPVWNPDFNLGTNTNVLGCAGNSGQGDLKKPEVKYESTGANAGSGACLKDFGDGGTPKYGTGAGEDYPYCGTDEAPGPSALKEMELHKSTGPNESIESVPVLQGAEAVLIHLPEGCKAQDEIVVGTKKVKQGRLALDDSTIEGIYRGTIRDWKDAITNQAGHGSDKLTCTGGTAEEETPINVVVRTDKSGTTHIFKSFLAQVNTSTQFQAEEFNTIEEENEVKKNPCGVVLPEELKTWFEIQEGCENQRWPTAAKVVRPEAPGKKGFKGNPGVVYQVAHVASSIGYADLAVARKENFFSAKCTTHPTECGGENKKGTETVVGEQHPRFWAEVQNSEVAGGSYSEPASNGDIEKAAQSNCAGTVYVGKIGETIPPKTTRLPWNTVKAALVQKKYAICGLTYDLALREYKPYLEFKKGSALTPAEETEDKAEAQTTRDYLLWELSSKTDGGGFYIKNHDYEKVTGTVQKEAETGVKEIGWATP